MRIGILGLGYVGLTLAIAASDKGIEVYGIEINPHIKQCLSENKAHFFEPGLNAIIRKVNNKNFFCVNSFPQNLKFDAFIITVGTPLKNNKKQPDFEYIRTALKSLKGIYSGNELIILRSTVSVGTTRNIVLPYLAEISGCPEEDLLVSMCPERTVEGKAVEELTHLPQIISGNNETALNIAQNLFRKITPYVIPVDSLEEAELVKLYCNTYRDMTFAIGNAFCRAAQMFGVNGMDVIKHANQGYSRSNICLPGFVAGPCLEKDAYILTNNMENCPSKEFIMFGRKFNESLENMVVEWVEKKIGSGDGKKIVALSGLTFKGIPETSDLRGSSSIYIARKLKQLGYVLHLHDFVAIPEEITALNLGTYFESLYNACDQALLLLVLNNNRKYADIEKKPEILNSKNNFSILDTWDICTNLKNETDINIYTLGNMYID